MKLLKIIFLSGLFCLVAPNLDAQPKPTQTKPKSADAAQNDPTSPQLSANDARHLAENLTHHRDAKTLAILSAHAHGRRWCELGFPQKKVSHRIRLFANLAYFARKQGELDQAWTCLNALLEPGGPVYGGKDEMPAALGLTLEAALLYEASYVFPHHITHAQEQAVSASKSKSRYQTCGPYDYGHTQAFMRCVLEVARHLKAKDAFKPEAMKQALLARSAELVPPGISTRHAHPQGARRGVGGELAASGPH